MPISPEIHDKPVIVCADVEARHDIVLAKIYPAKTLGQNRGS
jgi:hypothetical protein